MNDMLAEADVKHDKVLKEKNAVIQLKDEEISELKSKMDDMSEEFGEMLRVSHFSSLSPFSSTPFPFSSSSSEQHHMSHVTLCIFTGNFGENARTH